MPGKLMILDHSKDALRMQQSQYSLVLSVSLVQRWSNPPIIISFILQATKEYPFPPTAWAPAISTMDLSDKIRNVIAPSGSRKGESSSIWALQKSFQRP